MKIDPGCIVFTAVIVLFLMAASFGIGHVCGWHDHRFLMQRESVERGFAEYDSYTGHWQWKATAPEKE